MVLLDSKAAIATCAWKPGVERNVMKYNKEDVVYKSKVSVTFNYEVGSILVYCCFIGLSILHQDSLTY